MRPAARCSIPTRQSRDAGSNASTPRAFTGIQFLNSPVATWVATAAASLLVHLLAIAAQGTWFGLPLTQFSFGYGATLLRAGRVRVGVLPVGGYVMFGQIDDKPAMEKLGLVAQLWLAVTGPVTLLVLSTCLVGASALPAFVAGLWQWPAGALSPLETGPELLAAARRQAVDGPFMVTLGLVAAKMAALNLLPIVGSNGWQVLATLGRRLGLSARALQTASRGMSIVSLLMFASWLIAIAWSSSRH